MRFWTKKAALEAFKFSLYLTVPLVTTIYCTNPKYMHVSDLPDE